MTREMPWAARHEAIDDFLGGMNWGKTLLFGRLSASRRLTCWLTWYTGTQFLKSLRIAYAARIRHQKKLDKLKATFNADVVKNWDAMVVAWDSDHGAPNPYEEPPTEGTCI